ncbi:MAG: M1 family metallopeptidase [Bacteroidota bacterium]
MNSSKYLKKVIHRISQYKKYSILALFYSIFCNISLSQGYWQQRVEYDMSIDFDVKTHQFSGNQTLKYYNNSPDTLYEVFYHLYFNAFQPQSMMDVRSRNLPDPDPRIGERIVHLDSSDFGYHHILKLTQDQVPLKYHVEGTILEVDLATPIPPNATSTFEMAFKSQVPTQIRRSGRTNKEGVDYSMSQWFPKMAEYDVRGWHATPYVEREFYSPWGDYKVSITIDKNYMLGGTGTVQNPEEVGHGYQQGEYQEINGDKITWKFKAENVHDFVWAADRNYLHVKKQVENGPLVHFFFQEQEDSQMWSEAIEYTIKAFPYIQKHFGKYPYTQFSVIQAGDGGMEYPMAILITSGRSLSSLTSVIIHELMHQWYYGILGNNESYAAWMDEGFTEYAEMYTKAFIYESKGRDTEFFNPVAAAYVSYIMWAKSGLEEPMSTHSDHFATNGAYTIAAYTKGKVTLQQLKYIIGKDNVDAGMLTYYDKWKFKHPWPNDFFRIMEKQSGIELDWYYDYWINSTHTIDYEINTVEPEEKNTTKITLKRLKRMPMPIDLWVTTKNGDTKLYYIPLGIMRGEKPNDFDVDRTVLPDWPWTHPEYSFTIDIPIKKIRKIEIDASGWMADIDRKNNIYPRED